MIDALLLVSSALCLGGAAYALGARHLMRGVLGLAAFFIGAAGLFAGMGAWFLAAGQLFLFVGGVVALFVLAFSSAPTPVQREGTLAAACAAGALTLALLAFLPVSLPQGAPLPPAALAQALFGEYGLALEIALLLLFAGIVGAQYLLAEGRA